MNAPLWKLPVGELVGLTSVRARDLMVECFFFAQHETFARAKQKLGATGTDGAALRASVVSAVRIAFKESGGDYDHPTAASLMNAAAVLGRKAESWGTPLDIIQHHSDQIGAMLRRIQ